MPDITSIKHLAEQLLTLIEGFFTLIVLKMIVAHWVAQRVETLFIWAFVRSKTDLATWLHYRNKASGNGHRHGLAECDDFDCAKI
jgi:hypothetical protein